MESLILLNKSIYKDLLEENRKNYKVYAEKLNQILTMCKDSPQQRKLLSITFYNLAKLSSRYKYLQTALQFTSPGIQKIKWNLQMLALASSRGNHQEAYTEACILIDQILLIIQNLSLSKQLEMFARELIQLIHRSKSNNVNNAKTLNQLQLSRKFETDCPYVNNSFHIADVMIMQGIDFQKYGEQPKLQDQKQFFYYIVFLSIACFTRATEKFYCRESADKDFHFKAIEICGYLYSGKSTHLRFLKRTYKQHYLQHLQQIQEVDQYGQMKMKIPIDPQQVPMQKMPWQNEQNY